MADQADEDVQPAQPLRAEPAAEVLVEGAADAPLEPQKAEKPIWNSLEVAKLIALFAVAACTAFSGVFVTKHFRELDELKQRRLDIQALSRAIAERRTRAAMLYSGIARYADLPDPSIAEELKRRKEAYDKTYVEWNTNFNAYTLALRTSSVGQDGAASIAGGYTKFDAYLQKSLVVGVFLPLDACLTEAYDAILQGKQAHPPMLILERCQAAPLLKLARICGYAITEQLHLLTYAPKGVDAGLEAIKTKCPLADSTTEEDR